MTHYIPGLGYINGAFTVAVPLEIDGQPVVTEDGQPVLTTVQYPSNWLRHASADDLARIGAVPQPAAGPGEAVEQGPEGWIVRPLTIEELAAEEDARRRDLAAQVNAERDRRLDMGAPYGGRLIEVTDKGRADLGGMAVTAVAASAGALPWPESYAQGWIAADNTRLPLPTPADGLALAAAVGDWYARTIQHARSLKVAALAGEAVDITAGWPE